MASASPTPVHSYGNGRPGRHPSVRPMVRRDSPLSALSHSQGFSSGALPLRSMGVGEDSDDDLQPPPVLSALGRSVLGEAPGESPKRSARPQKLRISRNNSPSNTPAKHDSTTPAPSLRVKRVGLQGAPVRRARRTPQGEDEADMQHSHYDPPPSQDQENLPVSVPRPTAKDFAKTDAGSIVKQSSINRVLVHRDRDRDHEPVPLAPKSTNTPHRPAPPPPPPKMSVLDAATKSAGAATTKQRKRRANFVVNGKVYTQLIRLGKGGSSDVYQVMAENSKVFALKRVKLEGADESAVMGYKGEIDLLKKLKNEERVVQLFDYSIEEEKQCLYVLMESGDTDLAKVLRVKLETDANASSNSNNGKLDIPFTRFYWQEMLACVQAVHEHDIVHSDLKPANFVLVGGILKLIDFGIANAIDIDNTVNVHRDSHVGTPNYMSPESLQDSSATEASKSDLSASNVQVSMGKLMKLGKPSDVWSLGCILYQMVYGRPPFGHIPNAIHRVMAIINHKVEIQYPPTGIGGVKVPPELKKTLKACLQRNPNARPTIVELMSERNDWMHPECHADLRISEELLGQIIGNVAKRFRAKDKPAPTDAEIQNYAPSFYAKIREWAEDG